jgi:hypothetical protein
LIGVCSRSLCNAINRLAAANTPIKSGQFFFLEILNNCKQSFCFSSFCWPVCRQSLLLYLSISHISNKVINTSTISHFVFNIYLG